MQSGPSSWYALRGYKTAGLFNRSLRGMGSHTPSGSETRPLAKARLSARLLHAKSTGKRVGIVARSAAGRNLYRAPARAKACYAFICVQSQRASASAASMPASCAATNAMTPPGAMPANVSEIERAMVTAGLANDVDAVNQ